MSERKERLMGFKDKFNELTDKAKETAGHLTEKPQPHVDKAIVKATETASSLSEKAKPHLDKAKDKVTEVTSGAKQRTDDAGAAAKEASDASSEEE